MPSPFDFDAFAATSVDLTQVDLDWHSLPDKTECLGQIASVNIENMEEVIARDPTKWRNPNMIKLTVEWEVKDPAILEEMNMSALTVRQPILIELSAPPPPAGNGTIRWDPNINQSLKDLIKATGLGSIKNFNVNLLKFRMGWLTLRNRRPEGFERDITEVAFVRDAELGRASYMARQEGRPNGHAAA